MCATRDARPWFKLPIAKILKDPEVAMVILSAGHLMSDPWMENVGKM